MAAPHPTDSRSRKPRPLRASTGGSSDPVSSDPISSDPVPSDPVSAEPWSADDWARYLSRELARPVRVRYTRARRRVIEATTGPSGVDVRLSGCFADAPPDVRADLARWMRVGRRARRACERLDAWIEGAASRMPPGRSARVRPAGAVYDLDELAAELLAAELAEEFGAGADGAALWPRVTWGARTGRRARHSLRLGSYDAEQGLVRIHPVLDQRGVPRWFVRYVLFHELLHAAVPPRDEDGRTLHHPPEYRRRERRYAAWARAQAWQAENLPALLRSTRTGQPLPVRTESLFDDLP